MRTTTIAVPGSPITQTDRGRHSRPGGDEPYEPVVLQRGSPIPIRQLRGSDQARSTEIPRKPADTDRQNPRQGVLGGSRGGRKGG